MSKKKPKPRNRPVSAQEVQQGITKTSDRVFFDEWTILFTIMRDKWGWGGKRLQRIWDMCNAVCADIGAGKAKFTDILEEMRALTGIHFEQWKPPYCSNA